jgi:hypothetical protein
MANPTTNYGFVLPTSSDLVTDLPADFDVALQGVDTRLKALQPGTTLGDLAYSSATANTNTRLAIGTTGQVLTVSGGVPAWTSPAGGGKVLQVVTATTTTSVTNATTTYADTNLTASITPIATSSKILVMVAQQAEAFRSGSYGAGLTVQIVRGSTAIWAPIRPSLYGAFGVTADAEVIGIVNLSYLDSPSTTSSTTYKTQFKADSASTSAKCQNGSSLSSIILMEIGA